MEAISSNKPSIYEQRNKKDTTKTITGIACASIPIADSLVKGVVYGGNVAGKATIALGTAKNWGLFIAGTALFNKAANSIINNVKPLRNFSEDHPWATSIGVLFSSVSMGSAVEYYGNKVLTKILGNKTFEEKLYNPLKNSSILQNKTLEKVVGRVSDFANGKGRLLGPVAMLGLGVLFIKDLFNLGKMDYQISKTK